MRLTGRSWSLTPLVVGVILVGALVALVLQGPGSAPARRAAPALPAKVLVPPRVTLASLRGTTVILHFWASWCEPCVKEAPQLALLARALGPDTALVGIDWSDSADGAASFVRRHAWHFPNLVDPGGRAGEGYRIHGLPTTIILDPRGRIVRTLPGPQTATRLLAETSSVRLSAR